MSYFDKDRAADSPAPRMSSFPKPGISSVGEYQQAGRPWLKQFTANNLGVDATAVVTRIDDSANKQEFPYVAKRVVINNTSAGGNVALISFCSLNVADDDTDTDSAALTHGNYYLLDGGTSLTLEAKCRRLYIGGNDGATPAISLYAELTGIEHDYDLDVEGISGISDA
jgi:hypothetical protein